jgi:hypothetical protein
MTTRKGNGKCNSRSPAGMTTRKGNSKCNSRSAAGMTTRKGDRFLRCFDDCDFVRGRGIRGAMLYRVMRVVWGERVQDSLHSVGDAELVVDAEEVIFYGVLAELQYGGQLGVAETVG